jgi:hypothetical protein
VFKQGPSATKKSRTLIPGTAPLKRDLQLIAVPYCVVY